VSKQEKIYLLHPISTFIQEFLSLFSLCLFLNPLSSLSPSSSFTIYLFLFPCVENLVLTLFRRRLESISKSEVRREREKKLNCNLVFFLPLP
jgi:hypothetical protein